MQEILLRNDKSWFPKSSKTDIFFKLDRKRLKKIIEVSKRVYRWWHFSLSNEVIENISNLVNRNRLENETIDDLLNRILDEFMHTDWEKYLDEKWKIQDWLLYDGNVFDHTKTQLSLVRYYGKVDVSWWYILETEYITLKLLTLIHDIWEIGRWDVLYGEKTDSLEEWEHILWEKLLFSLFKEWVLSYEEKKLLEKIYEINFDKEHPLYKIFTNYEKLSYMTGAISAYENPEKVNKPLELVYNVLWNQIKPLIERADVVPSIRLFLEDKKDIISSMFDYIDQSGFQHNDEKRNKLYEEAKQFWHSYR